MPFLPAPFTEVFKTLFLLLSCAFIIVLVIAAIVNSLSSRWLIKMAQRGISGFDYQPKPFYVRIDLFLLGKFFKIRTDAGLTQATRGFYPPMPKPVPPPPKPPPGRQVQ